MHCGDGIVRGNDKYGLCKRNRDNYRRGWGNGVFDKVTEWYQVEADIQDIDIVYIVDQTALDEKTSVLCHIDDGD